MGIYFVWQACDSRVKICVSPARWLDFALQGSKNTRNLWFSIIRIISGRHSLFQCFPLLDAGGARALVAKQNPQSATRQRCDAMSSCRPMCTFFCVCFGFFCGASTEVAITWCPQFKHFAIWHNHFDNTVIYFLVITYTFSVNIYKSRQNDKFEPTLPPPTRIPPDDHTTACATCASSVTSRKCSSRTLIHHPHPTPTPDDHTTAVHLP